ncbi:uncharacterized protein Z519_05648 [Cladophialophora bantiana CBS 173.52]|uniref:Uncharacterized protein n=1 Tax=Cladophialophora bantiana (strain ATCC 10958 / CBS 173.52 / CDC B-1940 / NIH 8579) TaxID=1442370 RepID=A0A0D2G6U0_CLAB1|nr:uncharacterized protein Z519_05648 [Cladophialophora bantiana CBS 173.52]KIW94332.1 hypothetical protein Z519_05648 [Cladophialophora bantiana CBS 173.52]
MRFMVAVAALVSGVAIAGSLTTINPCPNATSTSATPITVTMQHQTVSTCSTTSACFRGACTTQYSMETFAYVSTIIPAAWDGSSVLTTTVTSTSQPVTVSRFHSTITKFATPISAFVENGTTSRVFPQPVFLTIVKDFMVPYNKIGPLAIPGCGGSGLCQECNVQRDGSRSQVVNVIECKPGLDGAMCIAYAETWISKPAPAASSTTLAPLATRFVAPSASTYAFTFTLTAPSHIITAGVETITITPSPFFHHVVRQCHRPREVIDFTIVVTKTIFWTVPCSRQPPPRTSSAVPIPTGFHAIPGFRQPGKGTDRSLNNLGGDTYDWAGWGSDEVTKPNLPLPPDWADWIATHSAIGSETSSVFQSSNFGSTSGPTSNSYMTSSSTYFSSATSATSSSFRSLTGLTGISSGSSSSSSLPQSSSTNNSPGNTSSASTASGVTISLSSGSSCPSMTSGVSIAMVSTSSLSGGPLPGLTLNLNLNLYLQLFHWS